MVLDNVVVASDLFPMLIGPIKYICERHSNQTSKSRLDTGKSGHSYHDQHEKKTLLTPRVN